MYKCCSCGEVFEEDEMNVWVEKQEGDAFPFAPNNVFRTCPYCNSEDFEEVEECEKCGEAVEELWNGLCKDCLKKELTLSRGKKFLISEKQLIQFMADEFFEVGVSGIWNDHLYNACEDYFDRLVKEHGPEWMEEYLMIWIFEGDASWGCEMFSKWLYENELI